MKKTPEFKNCLGMRFRRLSRVVSNMYNEHLKHYGMDISLVNILFAVDSRLGVHQVEIGKSLILERSTLSRDLQKLKKLKLIDTVKVDGYRSLSLHLTRKGKALVARMKKDWAQLQLSIEDKIGDDLVNSITKLEKAIIENK